MSTRLIISILALIYLLNSCDDPGEVQNKIFINTTWYSQEIEYSGNDKPNNIVLKFSADSVEFNLPGGDGLLASTLLREQSPTTPTHFMSTYSSNNNEVILDPGFNGYNIHLEISGDSLIWKGGLPVSREYISLKKEGPVESLK